MSATLFLAFCILGCDLLLYFLFQWTYGEKRRGLARRSKSLHGTAHPPKARPLEFVSRKVRSVSMGERFKAMGLLTSRNQESGYDADSERRAYQRIAASFAHAKR